MAFRELSSYDSFSFHPSLPILASVCSLREADDNSSGDSPMAIRVWEFDYNSFLSNPPFMDEFNKREADIRKKLLREEITEDLEYIKVGRSPTKGIKLRQIFRGHTERIQEISWSPDGRYLASPSDDKTVRIWDEVTGECFVTFEEQDEIKHSAWSPNGQDLVYGGNKQIKLWNTKGREVVDILQGDFLRLDSLAFSPDGRMLALAYGANTIQILDTSTWREVSKRVFDKRSNCRINIQWSENNHQIVVSPYVGLLQVLDAQTLTVAKEIVVPGDHTEYSTYTYTKLGNKLAIAEEKKPIMIFDLKSGQFEKEFSDVTSYSSGLVFSPDGDVLVSWCHDNSVYFWHTDTGQKLARIHEYSLRIIEPVYPSFHPTKPSLVTFCDKRRSMRIWDIDYKELLG
jgi:WD40 repeat protein